jgi:hypothetical protein
MRKRYLHTTVAVGALAAAIAAAPIVSAQYTHNPFFDSTLVLSQAIGFELALQRLFIVENVPAPWDEEFGEVVENLAGPDWERFGGTLASLDAGLAEELHELLEEIAEEAEEGEADEVMEMLPDARALLQQAYDLVVPPEVRNDPAIRGGIMAQLLLGEGGVAEGLEEAFEEEWEFANGWAATQRIKVLWADIRGMATADQQLEIDDAIAEFDRIYPSPFPPESLAGVDPEEGETPAQRMVGVLEVVLDTQLYAGRDLVALSAFLEDFAAQACPMFADGNEAQGREVIYAVMDHYAGETTGLGDLIGLFAPEVFEEAEKALAQLVLVEEEEEEGEESDDSDEEEEEDERPTGAEAAAACNALVEAIGEGRAVLGG